MEVVQHAIRWRSALMLRARGWQRRRMRMPDLLPNADAVTPQLMVGAFIDADDWTVLFRQGVRVVVSLQGERHDEAVFGELQPLGYLRLPTPDFTPPTEAQLRMGAAFIDEAIKAGEKVLVHCHAGVGRSTMQCAAYLILTGMDLDEAWNTIKNNRPQATWNDQQQAAMEHFAHTIAAERTARVVPIAGPTPPTE